MVLSATIGLTLSKGKCEVVPAAGTSCTFARESFPGWLWKPGRDVKLLGAPLGDPAFYASLTAKGVDKVQVLLQEMGAIRCSQGALRVLRHCGSVPNCHIRFGRETKEGNPKPLVQHSYYSPRCQISEFPQHGTKHPLQRTNVRMSTNTLGTSRPKRSPLERWRATSTLTMYLMDWHLVTVISL